MNALDPRRAGLESATMHSLVRKQLARSLDTITQVLADEDLHHTLVQAAELTAESMKSGGKLLVCGNGGSAADAQHLVAEFVSRLTFDRPALPAISLTTDSSILTAVGNDYAFEQIFERQVQALGRPGDVLLAISTSGHSKNCLLALEKANDLGLHTIAFTGNGGGVLREIAALTLVVPSQVTMHIQEAHLALEHTFCMLVECFYFGAEAGRKYDPSL